LPLVTVPDGGTKPITLVYPYYENPKFFEVQLRQWSWLAHESAAVRDRLSIIVVDDGSVDSPAQGVLDRVGPCGLSMRLFRVDVDVRWNWLAARNIGLRHAPDGWVCVTDMDHLIPMGTMRGLIAGQHDSSVIYGFARLDVKGEHHEPIGPHPNSWFLTRNMFWTVGGYDETLSGHYGTDSDWRKRCAAVAPMHILDTPLLRHEYVEDSSTTRYLRKQPQDRRVRELIAARRPGWTPKTLSFPYHEVTA
jgi:hypothetical protein